MLITALLACTLQAPEHNPWRWSDDQTCLAAYIVEQADANNIKPTVLLAIAWAESNLRHTAHNPRSHDYGMMQINYRAWHESLGYPNKRAFSKAMRDPRKNVAAAVHVVNTYRKYKWCRGNKIFRCYNGGPWWWKQRKHESDARFRRRLDHVNNYNRRLHDVLRRVRRHYGKWVQAQRKFVCEREVLASVPEGVDTWN